MTFRTLLWALLAVLPLQDRKSPVPDAAAQKEAEKLVREVFKEAFKSKTTLGLRIVEPDVFHISTMSVTTPKN